MNWLVQHQTISYLFQLKSGIKNEKKDVAKPQIIYLI